MSFEDVQFFDRGEPAAVATADVLAAFPEAIEPDPFGFRRLVYGAQSWCDLNLSRDANGDAVGVLILRPVKEPRLWDGIWRLLQLGNAVLFTSSGDRPLLARSEVTAHLPAALLEALGEPLVVASGEAIAAAIESPPP
ncbi:MAG: hypothetical protein ACXVCV_07100 [Polyangia bacterium]